MGGMTLPEIAANAVPEGAPLLDVRETDEWRAGHAPDAQHIPMSELQNRVGEVPQGAPVYVICRIGGRSAQVTAWLNRVGWDAVNVVGGMEAWAAVGRAMVSDTGQPPYVA
jgi:rhodanese-related sulfurtransferase